MRTSNSDAVTVWERLLARLKLFVELPNPKIAWEDPGPLVELITSVSFLFSKELKGLLKSVKIV